MTHLLTLALAFAGNALWQAPLLLAFGWLAARLYRNASPAANHRLWSLVLALQVFFPLLCAAASLIPELSQTWWPFLRRSHTSAGVTVSFGTVLASGQQSESRSLLLWLTAAYGVGTAVFVCRFLHAVVRTGQLRRGGSLPQLPDAAAAIWEQYRTALAGSGAELLESPKVTTPMVLGIGRPCVMVPAGLATIVSMAEWEAMLAHECAHIRRHDFAKNLLWNLVTLPLAWHPAVRCVRSCLAETRESVCDALAAQRVGTPVEYARALVRLATRLLPAPPAASLHAIGMLDANALERRVMQLLNGNKAEGWVRRTVRLAACGALAMVTCASAWAWRSEVSVPEAPVAQVPDQSQKAVQVASGVIAGLKEGGEHPEYPADARTAHIEGAVVLSATISATGEIENLQVVSGPEELRQSAVDAVRTWHYKPYVLNGEATAVQTTITVNYHLDS